MESKQRTFESWQSNYEKACAKMKECAARSKKVFIEAAAQHPLTDGLHPAWEFESRLRVAARMLMSPAVYLDNASISSRDVYIYVPGGRHKKDGVEDKVSLSEAGLTWLRDQVFELHTQLLGGDETNKRLTDGRGIFNGEDECLAAVRMFEEVGAGRFICVCSQGQMMRKALAYIELGYYPEFVVLPGVHHNPVWEAFKAIPKMLNNGTAMSDEERDMRIAGDSVQGTSTSTAQGAEVFVYHEYSDNQPYGNQILRVFRDQDVGIGFLRGRVEKVLERSWDEVLATASMEDTITPNYVSVNEHGVYKFFVLDTKLPEE